MMHILIAPNAFKGSLTAVEAADAIAAGIRRVFPDADCQCFPVADGGDGTAEVLVRGTRGYFVPCETVDALNRPITARFGMLGDGSTGVAELADAAGLRLLAEGKHAPLEATTRGVGLLLRACLDAGAQRMVLGLGGSATTDGGAGMAQALGARLLRADGGEVGWGGAALGDLHRADLSDIDPRLAAVPLYVAVDVQSPLLGASGAARMFAPQKGASPEQVEQLEQSLTHYAAVLARDGVAGEVAALPGGGAAGGSAAGAVALLGARMVSGADLVLDTLGFDAALDGCELVITGEGRLDGQTVHGKAPHIVARRAAARGIPVVAFAGSTDGGTHGMDAVLPIVPAPMPLEQAMTQTAALLADTAERLMRLRAVFRR